MRLQAEVLWQRSELGELLQAVARLSKLDVKATEVQSPVGQVDEWMDTACDHFGIEAEKCVTRFADAAPAVLETADGYVGVVAASRKTLRVVARDHSLKSIALGDVEETRKTSIETSLDAARKSARATTAGGTSAGATTVWQLRTRPGAGIWRQLRESGLVKRFALLMGAHAVEYSLWIAAWWVIGQGVLEGRIDRGWLAAWILLLATIVPFRVISTWNRGCLAVACGGLLRQRLLAGILKLDPAETRTQGAGQLLGQTFEAEAVESLALSGGIGSLLALVEMCVVMFVMLQGAGGMLETVAFAATLSAGASLALRTCRQRREWTERRLTLTHDLIEKMTGYRTRAVQQSSDDWHTGEDHALDEYLAASRKMDDDAARLSTVLPRAWLLVGIAAMAPAYLHAASASASSTAVANAIAVGAILMAYRAIARLSAGAMQLSGAWIAWTRVSQLFKAAERSEAPAAFGTTGSTAQRGETILDARQVAFAHAGRVEVFKGANCTVREGDWILLEGPSGGGKSSLASVLAGVREPSAGLLLANGLDRRTLGSRGWRKAVAAAPQYHENHVISGTMAFNLLLGRETPHTSEDLRDAEEVCGELGLDALLRRMPGGLQQMVGETGWQLSQGERSRLFLARALLQNSRMVILDESFAALDPENLRQALECSLRRSKALMVVAHP
jgi:ATP-binding cassette subfamily B protein